MNHKGCVACGGKGIKRKWGDRRRYRYFVAVYQETWPLHDHDIEDLHGPLSPKSYLPNGLKYQVARNPTGLVGEQVRGTPAAYTEKLMACGRFTKDWTAARTFASDREADRTVERLASGLPIFITRAVAILAVPLVVAPAWISAVVMLVAESCD